MNPLRQAAQELAPAMLDRLRVLVRTESPPGAVRYLTACADLLAGWGQEVLGRPAERIVHGGLPHLLWPATEQRVLLLGHFDTVWPAGTIDHWPFAVSGDTATGPGVCDMKAGIVQMLAALGLAGDTSTVGVLLTSDEESGSEWSRPLIEDQASRSGAVLVLEPTTPSGALKVARKGGSAYRLTVQGRAAHAGVEPHLGINATIELAHQVLAMRTLSSSKDGTSVTPTVAAAGTASNMVPESAALSVDVRAWTRDELERVDRAIRALTPRIAGATLTVGGGVNRFPMPAELAAPLLEQARIAAKEIGLPPPESAYAPGASDGNFTAALGVPTLDGLGAVGGHPHSRAEYVDVAAMPDQTALLAALLRRLAGQQ